MRRDIIRRFFWKARPQGQIKLPSCGSDAAESGLAQKSPNLANKQQATGPLDANKGHLAWRSTNIMIDNHPKVRLQDLIKASKAIWCTWAQTWQASNKQQVFWPQKQQPHESTKGEGYKYCWLTCKSAARHGRTLTALLALRSWCQNISNNTGEPLKRRA